MNIQDSDEYTPVGPQDSPIFEIADETPLDTVTQVLEITYQQLQSLTELVGALERRVEYLEQETLQ